MTQKLSLKEELQKRGLIYQYTDEKLFEEYDKWGKVLYLWVDPTADSLQLWNLVPIMAAVNFMKRGNKLILILWGATGMIGDPSWKDKERQLKSIEEIKKNWEKIYRQLVDILDRLSKFSGIKLESEVVNNYDFYKNMSILEFLRDVGKYITVNQMIAKESVKRRLQDPERWISYTEFSYMLLQWYDFLKLYEDKNVQLQIWWSDQWWNIVTGIELIRKKLGKDNAWWFTVPLLTTSDGKKFGKSEGNAIWIDPNKNSPYFVYQYFINTTDEDVEKFLKILTLLDLEEINKIVEKHFEKPEKRFGQKKLAYEIVKFLFGEDEAEIAKNISELLFWKENKLEILSKFNNQWLERLFNEIWGIKNIKLPISILDILVESWLAKSKSEARKLIKQWWIYLNEKLINDINYQITDKDFIKNIALLRKWKKSYKLLIK